MNKNGFKKDRNNSNSHWTFLSNHTHVLVLLAKNPDLLMRNIAGKVGITERAVQNIISDLEDADIIEKVRQGRRNHYLINDDRYLRHPIERNCTVGELIGLLSKKVSD